MVCHITHLIHLLKDSSFPLYRLSLKQNGRYVAGRSGVLDKSPIIWCDCHISERFSAIKPGSIHRFLHLEIPVQRQECDSCPIVWFVLSFNFAIRLGLSVLNYSRSSVILWFNFSHTTSDYSLILLVLCRN